MSKLSEDQKKRSSLEMELFVFPNSSTDLRSDVHQSQIIGGDTDEDHTQIVGGDISTPGFSTPGCKESNRQKFAVHHIEIQ